MTDEEYKATKVAEAQAAVDAARAKVKKLEVHLDGARQGVDVALADLEAVQGTDYVWEPSGEHVTASAR